MLHRSPPRRRRRRMMPAADSVILYSLFLVFFLSSSLDDGVRFAHGETEEKNEKHQEMWPLKGMDYMRMIMMNDTRRKLGSFQICALCTCCGGGGGGGGGGGSRGYCLPSPCCYAINCNIPNRPFGFCSFTPKTCNCFGCHL